MSYSDRSKATTYSVFCVQCTVPKRGTSPRKFFTSIATMYILWTKLLFKRLFYIQLFLSHRVFFFLIQRIIFIGSRHVTFYYYYYFFFFYFAHTNNYSTSHLQFITGNCYRLQKRKKKKDKVHKNTIVYILTVKRRTSGDFWAHCRRTSGDFCSGPVSLRNQRYNNGCRTFQRFEVIVKNSVYCKEMFSLQILRIMGGFVLK